MTFEENLKQLQQVTKQLEQSTLPLEEALALYQKGVQLSDACQTALQEAEKQFSLTVVAAGWKKGGSSVAGITAG